MKKETLKKEFWDPIFEGTKFKQYIKEAYQIGGRNEIIDVDNGRE